MSESKEKTSGSIFSQPNWTVQGDVYNTAGDLILSRQSSNSDFLKAIHDLKKSEFELCLDRVQTQTS